MAKQKQIDDKLYRLITEEFYLNAESYTLEDIQEILVENQYICTQLEKDMINRNRCPMCNGNLLTKVIGYENSEYQGFSEKEPICIKACKDDSCGFEVN